MSLRLRYLAIFLLAVVSTSIKAQTAKPVHSTTEEKIGGFSNPGGRYASSSWVDMQGKMWLFGGYGNTAQGNGVMNDLWIFDISTAEWMRAGGDSFPNKIGYYGIKGRTSVNSLPAARKGAVSWTDGSGNLWLYGGETIKGTDTAAYLNDLWKYSSSLKQWTWVSGDSIPGKLSVYGYQGNQNVQPGGRSFSVGWSDGCGNLWLFGGHGYAATTDIGALNDLWKYSTSTGTWSWVNGDTSINAKGIYDPSSVNSKPGARWAGTGWGDGSGTQWLFAGKGQAANGDSTLNDLWKYEVANNRWVFIKGDTTVASSISSSPVSSATMPFFREESSTWLDRFGNAWIYGGSAFQGDLNDIWKFNRQSKADTVIACESYYWYGKTYSASGEYLQKVLTSRGCDSIVRLFLIINHPTKSEVTVVSCTNYSWNGKTYTASGDYSYVSSNAANCDSLALLHLTIRGNCTASETKVISCGNYVWNGGTYSQSGDYAYFTTTTRGTDSVANLHLIIDNVSAATQVTNVLCNGTTSGAISITPTKGVAPFQYRIQNSNYQPGSVFTGLSAGYYQTGVRDANGCIANIDSVHIIQPESIGVTDTVINVKCYDNAQGFVSLTVSGGTPPYLYKLENYQLTPDFFRLKAGTYSFEIKDKNGCITRHDSVNVTQPPFFSVGYTVKDVGCYGASTGMVTFAASGGTVPYSYKLSSFRPSGKFPNLKAGNYSFVVLDSNGCKVEFDTIIVKQPLPLTDSVVSRDVACNGTATGFVSLKTAGGTPPYSYKLASTFGASSDFPGLKAGKYQFTIKDTRGCELTTDSVVIGQPSPLAVTSKVKDVLCYGGSTGAVSLSASGGTSPYLFKLSSFKSFGDFPGLKAGVYAFTVKDTLGCSVTLSATIKQPDQLIPSFTKKDLSCFGANNGSVVSSATGGTGNYLYKLNTSAGYQQSGLFSNLAAGQYRLFVTDEKNCAASIGYFQITQPSSLVANYTTKNVMCFGSATGQINATVIGGTPPYKFRLGSNGIYQSNGNFVNLKSGPFNLFIQDTLGCSVKKVVVVGTASQILLNIVKSDVSTNGATDGSITINASGGSGTLSYRLGSTGILQSSSTFSGLKAATYKVFVRDTANCQVSQSVTINQSSFARGSKKVQPTEGFDVEVSGNPSFGGFSVLLTGRRDIATSLMIVDAIGRIWYRSKVSVGQRILLGSNFSPGVYLLYVNQGNDLKTIKLVRN